MHPDLLQPPHLLPTLVDLFTGEDVAAPTDAQITHIATCPYCRVTFTAFQQAIRDAEAMERYTQQAAYAEAVVLHGTAEAGRRYPDVVRHVERCQACRETVAETIAWLREE